MGKLFIVSGPSGVGKSSLMKEVLKNEIVSTTTRKIRIYDNEINGIHYYFVSKEVFENMIENNELAEWSEYHNNYYGISYDEIKKKILLDEDCYVIVEINGMKKLKNIFPDSVSIFINTDKNDIINLLSSRSETEEEINKRISTFDDETTNSVHYDYIVNNIFNFKDKAINELKDIINSEKNK